MNKAHKVSKGHPKWCQCGHNPKKQKPTSRKKLNMAGSKTSRNKAGYTSDASGNDSAKRSIHKSNDVKPGIKRTATATFLDRIQRQYPPDESIPIKDRMPTGRRGDSKTTNSEESATKQTNKMPARIHYG
ncbi:hypothetical protein ACMFMG_010228 [Clarireedia jacksonii]